MIEGITGLIRNIDFSDARRRTGKRRARPCTSTVMVLSETASDSLQATGMAFFGLYGSTAALATTLALSAMVSCVGIGFQRGTHTRWQLVANDASGSPTLVDMGASFAIATGGVLTLTIVAAPNAGSVGPWGFCGSPKKGGATPRIPPWPG